MNILLVGRHTPDFGGERVNIVGQEAPTFSTDARGSMSTIVDLAWKAKELDAALVFQNTPSQVAVAIARINDWPCTRGVGVIVSVPGKREAGVRKTVHCTTMEDAHDIIQAATFANPNAKVEQDGTTVTIVVDPPMKFVYSHIEWLWQE